MNPAIAFLLTVVVITGAVLWVVLRPLLAARAEQNNRAEDGTTVDAASVNTNVQALRIELAEARRDHRLGLLSATSLAEAERELETRWQAGRPRERQ